MPFPFAEVSTLFQRLEAIELREPPLLPDEKVQPIRLVIDSWFKSHRSAIRALTVEGATALLSALLPEKRTDRVYALQAPSLCRLLSRCLKLQAHRARDLQLYRIPGHGDLAACLERILDTGGPPALPIATLEEVDTLLVTLAGYSIFSDPSISRLPPGSSEARDVLLANILNRLSPSEAKWLIRLVLKDLSPLKLDEAYILRSFHFLLPDLIRFQSTFIFAVALLKGPLKEYPDRPDPRSERLLRKQAASLIQPCVGLKVGRPEFTKARSIDHCMKMLAGRRWVLERKYDGEYCEVHIDLSISTIPAECIKIFSKSGKDSTQDRKGIHKTLVRCLRLGRPECKIKKRAIILGELFVWSDHSKEPLPFDKIRKFVTRSGRSIGTDEDSQRHPDEHLAIAFFDVLLLDEEIVMTKPVEERRQWLREIYTKVDGRAMSAQWKVVDFTDKEKSRKVLVQQFAASNAGRCEGLVLKPCGLPYFPLHSNIDGFKHGFIKLKSDYISETGDEADFAVIGASYNAQQGLKSGMKNLKWTNFHLGALLNKEDVCRYGSRPQYRLVGTIQQDLCIPKPILQTANLIASIIAEPYDPQHQPSKFDLSNPMGTKVDTVFTSPFVFEVLGAGFQKPSNSNHYMLRHARVKKLHQDRGWRDCISFRELQDQATAALAAALDSESQETRRWIERLEKKCRRKFEREKTATPKSAATSELMIEGFGVQLQSSPCADRSSGRSMSDARTPLHQLQNNSLLPLPTTSRRHVAETSWLNDSTLLSTQPTTDMKRKSNAVDSAPEPALKRARTAKCVHTQSPNRHIEESDAVARPCDTSLRNVNCSKTCLLNNATLYLAPCVHKMSHVNEALLSRHSPLALVPSLRYWDRASFAHDRLSATVSESQSYPGMAKIVILDTERKDDMEDVLDQVLALNEGRFQERVEVWDWRVLESLDGHVLNSSNRKWFIGATIWDEGKDCNVFVRNRSWE